MSIGQLKLFLIYTVLRRTRHISSLFGIYHECVSRLLPYKKLVGFSLSVTSVLIVSGFYCSLWLQ